MWASTCTRCTPQSTVHTPESTINKSGFPSHLLLEEQVGWGTWLTITYLARKINCETCTSRSSTSLSPSPSSSWSGRWAPAAPTSTPSPAGSLTPATSLTVSIMVLLVAGEDMLAVLLQVLLFSSPQSKWPPSGSQLNTIPQVMEVLMQGYGQGWKPWRWKVMNSNLDLNWRVDLYNWDTMHW